MARTVYLVAINKDGLEATLRVQFEPPEKGVRILARCTLSESMPSEDATNAVLTTEEIGTIFKAGWAGGVGSAHNPHAGGIWHLK